MIRGSDLSLLRNQVLTWVRNEAPPAQKEYFSLVFEDFLPPEEVALNLGLANDSVKSSLNVLRDKILAAKPFLKTEEALKYKGAARILKLLAIQCKRENNEAHNARDYSYTRLFKNICEIVEEEGTESQKEVYDEWFVKGRKQTEIAAEFDRCQPTIHKTIYGNRDYLHDQHYGGIISKVGKHLNKREVPYCCHLINPYGSLFSYLFAKKD